MQCEDEGSDTLTSQGKAVKPPEARREEWNRFSPTAFRRNHLSLHVKHGHTYSTMKGHISLISATRLWRFVTQPSQTYTATWTHPRLFTSFCLSLFTSLHPQKAYIFGSLLTFPLGLVHATHTSSRGVQKPPHWPSRLSLSPSFPCSQKDSYLFLCSKPSKGFPLHSEESQGQPLTTGPQYGSYNFTNLSHMPAVLQNTGLPAGPQTPWACTHLRAFAHAALCPPRYACPLLLQGFIQMLFPQSVLLWPLYWKRLFFWTPFLFCFIFSLGLPLNILSIFLL